MRPGVVQKSNALELIALNWTAPRCGYAAINFLFRVLCVKKVTVVGAGNVGANCALRIAGKKNLPTSCWVERCGGACRKARVSTFAQSGPVEGYDVAVIGANDYEPTANSRQFVVITAGFPPQAWA